MDDPFAELLKLLQSLFNSATVRNGKYIIKPIQDLKEATDTYSQQQKRTFYTLLKALAEAIPYIEKKPINFSQISHCMDSLGKKHGILRIDWHAILEKHRRSSRFQFIIYRANEKNLDSWLSIKIGKSFDQLNQTEKIQTLLDYKNHHGFSSRLNSYLKKNPEFLFRLIMNSFTNFTKIASTRLNLYLTDKQLATAIIQHLPEIINSEQFTTNQVDELVDKVNRMLSNGRSINTLLRNTEAKAILENSAYFRIYQNKEKQQIKSVGYNSDRPTPSKR